MKRAAAEAVEAVEETEAADDGGDGVCAILPSCWRTKPELENTF